MLSFYFAPFICLLKLNMCFFQVKMSLSRVLPQNLGRAVICIRSSSHSASASATSLDERPSFFQKLAHRFKGIPLQGETEAPKGAFEDCGKEWFAPKPLPEVPKDFKEYPERDLVNYPYPARPMYPPKTRLLMVPDSWCTPFHKITGTSGPYLFFGGLCTFLVNKELWVFEEQGHMTVGWILFYLLLSRTVGYRVDKYLYGEYQNRMDYFKGLIAEDLKDAVEFRKTSKLESESFATIKGAFPTILKENMGLQLEANYRQNVNTVSQELTRRINYQKDTEETKARFERNIMLKWIVDGVETQAKDAKFRAAYFDGALQDLKRVATTL